MLRFVLAVTVKTPLCQQGHQTLCDQEGWRSLIATVILLLSSRSCEAQAQAFFLLRVTDSTNTDPRSDCHEVLWSVTYKSFF